MDTELTRLPSLWRAYAAALLARRVRDGTAPRLALAVAAVTADPAVLARYNAACGTGPGMPATYPFVLTFPAVLAMLADPRWPLPLPGLVHVGVSIVRSAPLAAGRAYRIRCAVDGVHETARGSEFDLVTELHDDGGCAWRGISRVLARGPRGGRSESSRRPEASGAPVGGFAASTRTARQYARAAGDWNPIHLGAFPARLLGFRRPVAHGMWTLARALAVLGAQDAASIDAAFTAPLTLPATATVLSTTDGRFSVVRDDGRVVLMGTCGSDALWERRNASRLMSR